MKFELKKFLDLLQFSYFAVVFASAFLSALTLLVIKMATGAYLLALPQPFSSLVSLALLSFFTIMSSKLVFKFAKKDAAGLAVALLLFMVSIFLFLYLASVIQGMEFIFWKTLLASGYYSSMLPILSALASALLYYGILYIFLEEKKSN